MTDLHDKVVWITGASSGIGEELARQTAYGNHLVLSARRASELERVAATCDGALSTLVVPLDLGDPESLRRAFAVVHERHGHIDVLINNAGVSQRSKALDTSVEVIRKLMDVDFFGPVELTRLVLPAMIDRKSGHIVVVSSMVGVFGTPMRSGYSAAKHALHGWFESMRAEHRADGIVVTIACPGFIRTGISRNALTADGSPQGRDDRTNTSGITAHECARGIVKAIRRNSVEVYVGGIKEKLAGYVKRASPATFARIISKARVT
jgi:dehydrogenase/reductase SDR family protein 7B